MMDLLFNAVLPPVFLVLIATFIFAVGYYRAVDVTRRAVDAEVDRRLLGRAAGGAEAAANAAAAKRVMDAEPFPEPDDDVDDVDVCLRVGMQVVCRLSENSHTHGVLLGFTMGTNASGGPDTEGPMLAVVDVGAAHPMPINVDLVEPRGVERAVGYRENADPKNWN